MKIKSIKKISLDTPKQYYDVINANPYNNFLIKTNTGYIGSHNCFFDEVSFQPNQDIEKQRLKAKNLVNTASARQQSRFMKGEKNPTLLVLASSKRTEQSYMETFIESKKKQESKTTLVVDEPQWVIRTDKNSETKFKVAIGNKFLDSEVLPLNCSEEEIQIYRNKGYKILDVPIGYYESFLDDINIALTDIAGISTTNTTRYISGQRLSEVITKDFKNAFTKDVIEVGNAKEDTAEYKDFFDLSRIDPDLKLKPLFIHWDMSLTGDKTGLAGVFIVGKRPPTGDNPSAAKDLFFKVPFVVSIKAPKGYQVSFEKNRNFVRWLRNQGFNIKGVSSDTYQSADLQQQLKAENFNCSIISVDRVTDKICQPYQNLRSVIYEKRILIPEDVLLQEEFLGLQRDSNGKIDHDPSGINSKDSSDAVCGALWNASQNAEQFAFDYGETLDLLLEASTGASSPEEQKKQITLAFEKEIQDLLSKPKQVSNNNLNKKEENKEAKLKEEKSFKPKPGKIDFGIDKAKPITNPNIINGILFW